VCSEEVALYSTVQKKRSVGSMERERKKARNKTPNILFLRIFQQYPPNIPSLQPLYLSPLSSSISSPLFFSAYQN